MSGRKKKAPAKATVTITIRDGARGCVNVAAEFDPPLDKDDKGTPAQHAACAVLETIMASTGASRARVKR